MISPALLLWFFCPWKRKDSINYPDNTCSESEDQIYRFWFGRLIRLVTTTSIQEDWLMDGWTDGWTDGWISYVRLTNGRERNLTIRCIHFVFFRFIKPRHVVSFTLLPFDSPSLINRASCRTISVYRSEMTAAQGSKVGENKRIRSSKAKLIENGSVGCECTSVHTLDTRLSAQRPGRVFILVEGTPPQSTLAPCCPRRETTTIKSSLYTSREVIWGLSG